MYPSNPIGPMAATGVGASGASGVAAGLTSGWLSMIMLGVFMFVALFTLLSATGALARIMPAVSGMFRRAPAKKSPSKTELMTMKRRYHTRDRS